MKKYISFFMMAFALSLGFASCSTETDEEPGGTNVEKMAGRWEVTISAYDKNGKLLNVLGTLDEVMTYNTSSNQLDSMWITDNNGFWQFTMKMGVNYNARTFSCAEANYDAAGKGKAIITNGRIMEGAAKNIHGMPNDSIVFDISFSDDETPYGIIYRFEGQRYNGFYE